MTDISQPLPPAGVSSPGLGPAYADRRRRLELKRRLIATLLVLFFGGNLLYILYITLLSGDGDALGYHWSSFNNALVGSGRLTAFLAGYVAVVEFLLLARLPFLERLLGFDKLTIWHRWNGHAVLYLSLAHVVLTVWGYSREEETKTSFFREYWNWLTLPQPAAPSAFSGGSVGSSVGGSVPPTLSINLGPPTTSPYPGIITATVGTALLLVVLVTSLVVVRRRLSYEWWYAVHFIAYAGIALAWFHMIPDGNELIAGRSHVFHWLTDANYWRGLFVVALVLVLWFRLLRPIVNTFRFGLRVAEVVEEGSGIVSMRISGRKLDRLKTRSGQFFFWRFLTKGFWYTQHPYSISEAPQDGSLRITVKNLGDHSGRFAQIPVGTRVFAEGPFGVFTEESRTREKALLIAGGIGITPVRALLEDMPGDLVALYRVVTPDDIVFKDELDSLAASRGAKISYVVGDHATPEGRDLLSPRHLQELVPDIADRDVYICGPVAMIDAIVPNLRRANVPRHHLHVERFAL